MAYKDNITMVHGCVEINIVIMGVSFTWKLTTLIYIYTSNSNTVTRPHPKTKTLDA